MFDWIMNPFGPKRAKYEFTAVFVMNSGKEIKVRCDDIKIQTNNGALISYKMDGAATNECMYLRLSEVDAVYYYRN